MAIVAGPQGSGKSTTFPVGTTGHDYFNVDARRAELAGRSQKIPARTVREFDVVWAWDTSARDVAARHVLTVVRGKVTYLAADAPNWLRTALRGTEYESFLGT